MRHKITLLERIILALLTYAIFIPLTVVISWLVHIKAFDIGLWAGSVVGIILANVAIDYRRQKGGDENV